MAQLCTITSAPCQACLLDAYRMWYALPYNNLFAMSRLMEKKEKKKTPLLSSRKLKLNKRMQYELSI